MNKWLAVCILFGSALPAQRTWVVDASNGAGTDFTDIPPAIAAATDGDVVLVRAGSYSSFTIDNKGLRVLAESTSRPIVTRPSSQPLDVITIRNLAAPRSVTVRGLEEWCYAEQRGIRIVDCAGRVQLEAVHIVVVAVASKRGGVHAESSQQVMLANCDVTGYPALSATASRVQATGGSLYGVSAYHAIDDIVVQGAPALELEDSRATVAGVDLHGGHGLAGTPFGLPLPSSAVRAINSELTLSGDAATVVLAGDDLGNRGFAHPGIVMNLGLLRADPTLTIRGTNAPPVSGPVIWQRSVSLGVGAVSATGEVAGEIVSPQGDLVALLAGIPMHRTPTPIGGLFVDCVLIPFVGMQDASEHAAWRFRVPRLAALERAPIALQAANLFAVGGALRLSNPVVVVNR